MADLNPHWVAWRQLEGPRARNWAFMAFISHCASQYRKLRGLRDTDFISGDDFTAFVMSRPFAEGIIDG